MTEEEAYKFLLNKGEVAEKIGDWLIDNFR